MKQNKKSIVVLVFLFMAFSSTLLINACDKNTDNTEVIPNVPVSVIIDMDFPAYYPLTQLGAYIYYDGGARGLIIYHGYDNEYYCFDRNCSYQPLKDCSQVVVEDNNIYARCGSLDVDSNFTECCASRFEMTSGYPSNGPAQRPLKQYFVNRQGNVLYINN